MDDMTPLAGRLSGALIQPERKPADAVGRSPATTTEKAPQERERADQVELSEQALQYDPQAEAARATERRIDEIRAQIEAEEYVITPDMLDVIAARLHEEVFGD